MRRITLSTATKEDLLRVRQSQLQRDKDMQAGKKPKWVVPSQEAEPEVAHCAYCDRPMEIKKKGQRFCRDKCRVYYHRKIPRKEK